jgi:hypothetical protein
LRADIYRPSSSPRGERRPVVVHLHGGSWMMSFKEFQGIPLLTHLAANGWITLNVDYRLSPSVAFPAHLIDVKRAIAWVREHAAALDADPSDLDAFAVAVARVLGDPDEARRMGERGRARVVERYLGVDSLLRYGALIESLDEGTRPPGASAPVDVSRSSL